jgi:hypothetical protein
MARGIQGPAALLGNTELRVRRRERRPHVLPTAASASDIARDPERDEHCRRHGRHLVGRLSIRGGGEREEAKLLRLDRFLEAEDRHLSREGDP